MPEEVASDARWRYDYCPEYNLDKDIINTYLKSIWGNYKYFVEVSPASWRDMFRDDCLNFLQRRGDDFRFWVPRELSRVG